MRQETNELKEILLRADKMDKKERFQVKYQKPKMKPINNLVNYGHRRDTKKNKQR